MKGIIGNPARGERFFNRDDVLADIMESLDENANLLISAPRRVGKTSILMNLLDNPPKDYYVVYVDTESLRTGNQFFKQLLSAILDSDALDNYGRFKANTMNSLKEWGSKLKSFSVTKGELNLEGTMERNYYNEFKTFLENTALDGKKILLLVDEFPVTIENIIQHDGAYSAIEFLQQNRTIRQHPKLNQKIQFIYTGSIGLFATVKKINASAEVNDLKEIRVGALRRKDAQTLTAALLEHYQIQSTTKHVDHLLDLIEWLIPFHIQLAVREVRDLYRSGETTIDATFMDKAFEQVVANGNIYFDHYRGRLQRTFEPTILHFIHELLNKLALKEKVHQNRLIDLADKHGMQDHYKTVLEQLEYDGYIVYLHDSKSYRFYSPIIKKWWQRNV